MGPSVARIRDDLDVPVLQFLTETDVLGIAGLGGFALAILCALFGKSTPFTPQELATLHPTRQDYVDEVSAATTKARAAGFIVPEDVPLIEAEANAAAVPR